MKAYKNIQILSTDHVFTEVCEIVIDHLEQDSPATKEVVLTMDCYCAMGEQFFTYYTTCLHEDANKVILSYNDKRFDSLTALKAWVNEHALMELEECNDSTWDRTRN